MTTIDLTPSECKMLIRMSAHGPALDSIVAKLKAAGAAPVKGKCPHTGCRHTPFGSEASLTAHLIEIHHYEDDPYGEDTAQTNAWDSFHRSELFA